MQTYDFTNVKDIKAHVASTESSYHGLLDQYKDAGTRYAYDVLFTDKYLTCRDVQLACVRHLQDLLRQGDDNFPYNYNEKFVALIEYFCRLLPNPDDTTQKIKPQHWQSFILDSLIGWRTPNAGVRFNTANISIARRQGKTWLASMLVNFYYFVVCWNATSQDLLVASYDSEHASKLFNDVSLQAKELINQPDFADGAKEKGVDAQTTQVIGKINKNIIRKGTSQGGGFDSFHNAIAVFDEIGNLKPALNETLKQITSGQNGIKNRMFVKISTAYPDIKVKFKHDEDVTRSAIEHDAIRDADTTFQIIYQQDDESEVFEEDTWEKSNPLLAELKGEKRRVLLESLIQDRDNNDREGTLETFVNKSLNIWSRRFKNSYLSLSNINENITSDFNVDNREVYIGFDASQVNDNTSYGFEFPFQENGKHMFFAKQYSFIPFAQAKTLESKSKQDGLDYQQLAQQGFCEITNTPSGTINPNQVYEWLVDYVKRHHLKVRAVCADPNLAKWFIKRISNYQPSWPLIEVAPTSWKLSNPTKDFQSQFLNGDIKILDDPLLIDGLNNAILVEDKGGGVKIDRQNRTSDHIDTTDALINAHYRAQYYYQDFHDEDGYNPMNNMNREERKAYFKSMFGG
ncbi:terminase large subunit [Lactiplantibacillus plantarum]|uniref:terminase TerL endonuclease subunit n=1 Tax=Lactiplantibacillus plantarum TaxID=1590 RepID=UPI00200E73EB|nr:terminase TerL endonuclease subunit [Lactiplantibacillus plantarum]UQB60367.1 terminase large subunit [Lactiplantibacillus plantarum]